MGLIPLLVAWILLVLVIVGLAMYRGFLTRGEDDIPHVASVTAAATESRQTILRKKLESVERWVKILTIVAIVGGILLAILFGYNEWMKSSRISG